MMVCHRGHGLEVLGHSRERLRDGRRITLIGPLDGHAHDGPRPVLRPFFGRSRSSCARSARVGVSMPDAYASRVKHS